jgi:hypothetical protein
MKNYLRRAKKNNNINEQQSDSDKNLNEAKKEEENIMIYDNINNKIVENVEKMNEIVNPINQNIDENNNQQEVNIQQIENNINNVNNDLISPQEIKDPEQTNLIEDKKEAIKPKEENKIQKEFQHIFQGKDFFSNNNYRVRLMHFTFFCIVVDILILQFLW